MISYVKPVELLAGIFYFSIFGHPESQPCNHHLVGLLNIDFFFPIINKRHS